MTKKKENGDDLYDRLWEMQSVLQRGTAGDYSARCNVSMKDVSGDNPLAMIAPSVNMLIAEVENRGIELDERQREQEKQLERLQEQQREIDAKLKIISRQADAIRELSTPILELWDGVLVLPIIGTVDTKRSREMMERLLSDISRRLPRYVILDITGVEVMDTAIANHFVKIVSAARLLGTTCILTGIQPPVAQTLVRIGVDLSHVLTRGSLKQGLKFCMS